MLQVAITSVIRSYQGKSGDSRTQHWALTAGAPAVQAMHDSPIRTKSGRTKTGNERDGTAHDSENWATSGCDGYVPPIE